jgi:hypothetical protein
MVPGTVQSPSGGHPGAIRRCRPGSEFPFFVADLAIVELDYHNVGQRLTKNIHLFVDFTQKCRNRESDFNFHSTWS